MFRLNDNVIIFIFNIRLNNILIFLVKYENNIHTYQIYRFIYTYNMNFLHKIIN